MHAKLQFSMREWLTLHELNSEVVLKYCSMIADKCRFHDYYSVTPNQGKALPYSLNQSLKDLVQPSLRKILCLPNASNCILSLAKIIQHEPDKLDQPYTEYSEIEKLPIIHLAWSGKAEDLICLAHEMAHAAQMILSTHVFMPPVAREVCAFIGELALIQFSQKRSDDLYQELCSVWHYENQRYFGSDVNQLTDDLKTGLSPYTYRHNYPLARITAMSLFASKSSEQLKGFFASGSDAMRQLDFSEILENLRSSNAPQVNYLF